MADLSPSDHTEIVNLTLGNTMSQNVLTVYEGWSVKRLAGFFIKHGITGAPVVASDETLVGVVTQTDVVRFEAMPPSDAEIKKILQSYYGPNVDTMTEADLRHLKEKAAETCTVNTIMTKGVLTMEPSTSVGEACSFMLANDVHRLFVTDQGRLVGVVTAMDMLRLFAN